MRNDRDVQAVFLIGAKSLGAYGGYETFVDKLTEYHQNNHKIQYYAACKANGDGSMDPYQTPGAEVLDEQHFVYHNAFCFRVKVAEKLGSAQAILYDVAALKRCCEIIEEQKIQHPIVYIMACRIGPFAAYFYHRIHKLGGTVYLNPDGHEWMRSKWSAPVRAYWKLSERIMIRYCDLVICDSIHIERYIHAQYDGKARHGSNPVTTFIAYGTDLTPSQIADDDHKLLDWYRQHELSKDGYYLVVCRFVPENSFETILREFMKTQTRRDLVLITNTNDKLLEKLEQKLHFQQDKRIKFVGTVYDQELLKKIRENAFGYFHGHTVGGTNPSLVEALGSTDLNLLVDVPFNKEVAEDGALYWNQQPGSLARLIGQAEQMSREQIEEMGRRAKQRIAQQYTWEKICGSYERYFCRENI